MSSETVAPERSLHRKLAEVMAAVESVPELGRNESQGYRYARDEDLVRAVRKELADRQVILLPAVGKVTVDRQWETKSGPQPIVRVEGVWSFIDGESGERHDVPMVGEGADAGDKGVYKAYTGALKYVIRQSFLIPTGDDPEEDGEPAAAANGRAATGAYPVGPAASNKRISEKQAARAWALKKAHDFTAAEWDNLLAVFEIGDPAELGWGDQYDAFCDFLERKKPLPDVDHPSDVPSPEAPAGAPADGAEIRF